MTSSRRTAPLPTNWPTLRAAILQRDHHTCQINTPGCTRHATEVDHITPAAAGGTDHPTNLQAACHTCHTHKTAQEANTARWARTPRRTRPPEQHPGLT